MKITVFKSNPEELKLEHVSVNDIGYTRQRRGKGFAYFDQGKKITDQNIFYQINNLRIPPNWKNVWICRKENGYLQSTGFDARGRKILNTNTTESEKIKPEDVLVREGG